MRGNDQDQQPTLQAWWGSAPPEGQPTSTDAARRASSTDQGEPRAAADRSGSGAATGLVAVPGRMDPPDAATPGVQTPATGQAPEDAGAPHGHGRPARCAGRSRACR